jgi:hypothetical protein
MTILPFGIDPAYAVGLMLGLGIGAVFGFLVGRWTHKEGLPP